MSGETDDPEVLGARIAAVLGATPESAAAWFFGWPARAEPPGPRR